MTATNYDQWVAEGRPWRDAPVIAAFAAVLRSHGYTVYTIGDYSHLTAQPPEDHTPYSATPWPGPQPYPQILAMDIMPGGGPTDWRELGRRIARDRSNNVAGTEWIKYINWTDFAGHCWHERWEPDHSTQPSTDTGHIHISARTDRIAVSLQGWSPVDSSVSPPGPDLLDVDGQLGPLTTTRWQRIMGTPQDGVITQPPGRSDLVAAVQRRLNGAIGANLTVDGVGIVQDGHTVYHTTAALQHYLGTPQDGLLSLPTSQCVRALQVRLNSGGF